MRPDRRCLLLLITLLTLSCSRYDIIPIEAGQLINETGYGAAIHWFDEPDTLSAPLTSWSTPGTESYWPAGVIIDLGEEIYIDHLKVYDGEKSDKNISGEWEHRGGKLTVSTGKPFQWEKIAQYSLSNNKSWQSIPIRKKLRYLQLQKISTEIYYWKESGPFLCDVNIMEIVMVGSPSPGKSSEEKSGNDQASHRAKFPMQDFIGANSYKWIPDSLNQAVGIIRDYHHWAANGVLDLDSGYSWFAQIGNIHMDEYYERIHLGGAFETFPDVHRHADPNLPGENKPAFGGDPAQPSSYALIADYFFQFAARQTVSYLLSVLALAYRNLQQGLQ